MLICTRTACGLPSAIWVTRIFIKGKTNKEETRRPASKTEYYSRPETTMWTQTNRAAVQRQPSHRPLFPTVSALKTYQNPYMRPPPQKKIKKNLGSREFTEIRHISLYYVYKKAFIPPSDSVCSIMPPCTWISYLLCEYLLLSSPIYASIFADAVVIGPQRSSLQWRLHLHRDVLYGITFFLMKKNSMFVI